MLTPGGSFIVWSCMAHKDKPPKTLDGMVELFKQRGLNIDIDQTKLKRILYTNNYYRLSGYFRVFQQNPSKGSSTSTGNNFLPETKVSDILSIYDADEEFRHLILIGTARVEVALRSILAYQMAQDGHAYDYTDPDIYKPGPVQAKAKGISMRKREHLIKDIRKWVSISKEVSIRHFMKADASIPLWAAIEVIPFSVLSTMFQLYDKKESVKRICRELGLGTKISKAATIMQAIVYLRNYCSHHCRLWHRETKITPVALKKARQRYPDFQYKPRSVANTVLTLMYIVDTINDNPDYSQMIRKFLEEHPKYRDGIVTPLHWE